jgi:hypothetical protein
MGTVLECSHADAAALLQRKLRMNRSRAAQCLATLAGLLTLVGAPCAQAGGVTSADVFANGVSVTIRGSGFGSKATAAPLQFFDYGNSSTLSSPLSRSAYTSQTRGSLSAAVVAPGSRSALQVDMGANEKAAGPLDGVTFHSSSVYVWIKHRYEFNIATASGPNGFNLKVFRLWYPWTHDIYVAYQGTGGSLAAVENTPTDTAVWFHMRPKDGVWVVDEYDYQSGSPNTADGVLQYARNGILAWPTTERFTMRTTALPQPYQVVYFDQVSNNEVAKGTYQYIDSIYVDDTRQRVIISDEPTWSTQVDTGTGTGTESHREVQIPTAWSDGQIQVTARQGSLDTFANKYLYVMGPDGNPVSNKGFPIAAGVAPNPPSGVAVK